MARAFDGVDALDHAIGCEAANHALARLPEHVLCVVDGVGVELYRHLPDDPEAVGWYRHERHVIQLAMAKLKAYPQRLQEAIAAHELAHAYAYRTPELRRVWDDEQAIDRLTETWGFPIKEARRCQSA